MNVQVEHTKFKEWSGVTLYPRQTEALNQLLQQKSGLLLAPPGAGKTIISMYILFEHLVLNTTTGQVILVTPKNLIATNYVPWCEKVGLKYTTDGSVKKNHITLVNREKLKKVEKEKFDLIIVDEVSLFKSPSGTFYKFLKALKKKAKYYYSFTGTFFCNSIISLFCQVKLLDESILGSSVVNFRREYMYETRIPGKLFVMYRDKPCSHEKIYNLVKSHVVEIDKAECAQVPYDITTIVYTFPDEVMKQYLELKDTQTNRSSASLYHIRHQFVSGGYYTRESSERSHVLVHHCRISAMHYVLKKYQPPTILVFYKYLFEKDLWLENFNYAVEFSVDKVDEWNRGEIKMFLLQIKSASHGLNLQHGGNHVFFTSIPDSHESFVQSISRLIRQDQEERVRVFIPITRHTVDVAYYNKLKEKTDIGGKFFGGMINLH